MDGNASAIIHGGRQLIVFLWSWYFIKSSFYDWHDKKMADWRLSLPELKYDSVIQAKVKQKTTTALFGFQTKAHNKMQLKLKYKIWASLPTSPLKNEEVSIGCLHSHEDTVDRVNNEMTPALPPICAIAASRDRENEKWKRSDNWTREYKNVSKIRTVSKSFSYSATF